MPERTRVRAGRLVDVLAGSVVPDHLITVQGDRIEAVGPYDGTPVDLDLSDHTVLPGLIDCHTHLVGEIESGHGYAHVIQRSAAQEALAGVANARDTLLAGFTTVRDVGTFRAFVDVALRDAIEVGSVEGPRMVCAGAYVTVSGGGGDVTGLPPDVDATVPRDLRFGVANSSDEVRRVVREILHGGADLIKVIATGAVLTEGTTPAAPEFGEGEIRAAVEEAAPYGAHVAAHAHAAEGIKRAVRAGVRSIEHGSLMDDEAIALMAERGTYLVADVWCGDWMLEQGERDGWSPSVMRKLRETTDVQREGFSKALEAGVRIAFGTDSGTYPHGMNARQFATMVKQGMTSMQAVQSATIMAAELLGRRELVGVIEPGALADVIAVEGDPLGDIELLTEVALVMKGGRVVRPG